VESYYDDPSIKNIKDTTSFELVEMMKDQHQLYKPNYDMNGIFPFKKTTIDSAKIYRYTTQNGIYTRKIYLFGNPSIYPGESDNHDITFSADTGVVRSEAVFYEWILIQLQTSTCSHSIHSIQMFT